MRSDGSSSSSTAAKNASRSRWARIGTPRTLRCRRDHRSPPPPAIEQPAPYQVSYGVVAGTAAPGTTRVIVRVGLADAGRPAAPRPPLPAARLPARRRDDGAGRHRRPRRAPQPRDRAARPRRGAGGRARVLHGAHDDVLLQRDGRRLAERFGEHERDLRRRTSRRERVRPGMRGPLSLPPPPSSSRSPSPHSRAPRARRRSGSTLDRLLRQMLTYSDNAAANATERYFGGSTSGGSALVNSLMRSLGLVDTEMYGGYELDSVGGRHALLAGGDPAPGRQPAVLGYAEEDERVRPRRLLRAVWLASGGRGPLRAAQPGSRRPTPATCSTCSPTSATRASSTARWDGSPASGCSTRPAGSTTPATTTASSSGGAGRSSSR